MEQAQQQALNEREQVTTDSVKSFQDSIPDIQKQVLAKVIRFIRSLEMVNGKVKPNISNLKAINRFVNVELKHTMRNGQYASNVIEFTKVFGDIAKLTDQYFKPIADAGN